MNSILVLVTNILSYLLNALAILVIVRVIFSWIPKMAWSRNPVVVFIKAVVDPLLRPIRKVVPVFGSMDFSPFILFLLLEFLANIVVELPSGQISPLNLLFGFVGTVLISIILVIFLALLIRFLFDALHADQSHPVVHIIQMWTNPFLQPFRRWLRPNSRGIDFAPLIACIGYFILAVVLELIFAKF